MNIGERIGDYEVVEILGAGGMGQVYKVRNVISDRMEAMKVLLPNMSGDPDLASRFLREIKTQAALDHPNIARLHTALQAGDQLFMVMEFVEGSSVEKLLQHGAMRLSDCVSYASQVLDALSYAHSHGVVHRDIKPANIMCTPSGAAKLMDFGIARMQADRHLTQPGHTVGSLYYMSPEQIQGSEPDPRSDLYSLGITFYEMVTGQKPFQGDSDYSIMAAHLQQTPAAPIEVVPGVPADLSEIILTAIAKDPAARFQSADAFRAALRHAGVPSAGPVATHTLRADAAPPPMPAPMPPPMFAAAPPPMATAPPPPFAPPMYQAPPPPAYSPAQAQPKSSGRRGLYMTLGSVATLLVLAVGIIEIPKLRHTSAQETPVLETSTPAVVAPPVTQVPELVPTPTPAPVETAPTPNPAPVAQNRPAPNPRPVQVQTPIQTPVPTPVQNPVVQQPAPVPQAVPAQPKAPPAPDPQRAQLNQLRQEYNQLSIRATTAKDGLRGIQQQMQSQGLNLRADVREAQTRMDYQLKEAMDSIRSGDTEQADKDLTMARLALESIEKFLGR